MNADTRNPLPELTYRQRQILKLLQEGKVNKAVAEELGIGLGTVKQHIVAIFRKLKVSNRTMAVSHGVEIEQEQQKRTAAPPMNNLLEHRPCVVLSMALPADANQLSVRLMYGSMAAIASAHDAIFLARNSNAGDLIFGIQRASEYDLARALKAVCHLYDDMCEIGSDTADQLRGCLTAGIAFASMQRFGGWTGEAIASTAIASARNILNSVPAGQFLFDATALDIIELFGISGNSELSRLIPLADLKQLHYTGARPIYKLAGRDDELIRLEAALKEATAGNGRLVLLKGEMGMGKSRLCEAIAAVCVRKKGTVSFFRSLPPLLGHTLYDILRKTQCLPEYVLETLRSPPASPPGLVIIDDIHVLTGELLSELIVAATVAVREGKLVILSGRAGVGENIPFPIETITLRRLPTASILSLVRSALRKGAVKERAKKVQQITSSAAGVPLFALELARHHNEPLGLPLRLAITARLDTLHLDQNLLREVARQSTGGSLDEIAARLGEQVEAVRQQMERAVASGVLSCSDEQWLTFTHPLLRRAIGNAVMGIP